VIQVFRKSQDGKYGLDLGLVMIKHLCDLQNYNLGIASCVDQSYI